MLLRAELTCNLRKFRVQRRALRQRQRRFPVLLLSTGGTCWHADQRRMSIAAAIQWALQSNLQGLVLDSGAVQEQSQAVALARSKGLKVCKSPALQSPSQWCPIRTPCPISAFWCDRAFFLGATRPQARSSTVLRWRLELLLQLQ